MHILPTDLYTFTEVLTKLNYSKNQELLYHAIISFYVVTFMCDSGVIFQGETTCYYCHLRGQRAETKMVVDFILINFSLNHAEHF